jgi:hypothetical protein
MANPGFCLLSGLLEAELLNLQSRLEAWNEGWLSIFPAEVTEAG